MIIYSYVHRYNKPQPCKHLDSQHSDPGCLKGDVSFSLGEEFVRHVDQGLVDMTRKHDVETGVACSNSNTEKHLVTIWKDLEKSGFGPSDLERNDAKLSPPISLDRSDGSASKSFNSRSPQDGPFYRQHGLPTY